jgi:hypothetical protein
MFDQLDTPVRTRHRVVMAMIVVRARSIRKEYRSMVHRVKRIPRWIPLLAKAPFRRPEAPGTPLRRWRRPRPHVSMAAKRGYCRRPMAPAVETDPSNLIGLGVPR